jgi:hypothetical protein
MAAMSTLAISIDQCQRGSWWSENNRATHAQPPAALPPIIDSEREGNIRRNFCADIGKHKPEPTYGPRMMRQFAEAEVNQQKVLSSITAGYDTAQRIANHTGLNIRTVWSHANALKAAGKVRINEKCKPWRFLTELPQ